MQITENRLIRCGDNDETLFAVLREAKQECIFPLHKTYFLQVRSGRYYAIRLSLIERIYGQITGFGLESFFKKNFPAKKIVHLLSPSERDLLTYNTARTVFRKNRRVKSEVVDQIYKQIEKEIPLWKGNEEFNAHISFMPSPLTGVMPRKEFWARSASYDAVDPMYPEFLEREVESQKKRVAIELGCGNGNASLALLKKGWKVISVDYSQEALTILQRRAAFINQEWLRTKQLTLICSAIETFNLETVVGPSQKAQDFESESFVMGAEHSQTVKAAPITSDYGSKDCAFRPAPTAVSRFKFPDSVDLIYAGSSLPYIDPKKIDSVMKMIRDSLKVDGHFIGNLFTSSLQMETRRQFGAWLLQEQDDVGYLLAAHGFELIDLQKDKEQVRSVCFMAKKDRPKR